MITSRSRLESIVSSVIVQNHAIHGPKIGITDSSLDPINDTIAHDPLKLLVLLGDSQGCRRPPGHRDNVEVILTTDGPLIDHLGACTAPEALILGRIGELHRAGTVTGHAPQIILDTGAPRKDHAIA